MVITMVITFGLITDNVITSTILNSYQKAPLCKYEFMHTSRSRANPSNFRIDRFWKFGCRLWPWTSAVLKGSLIIGV